MRRKNITSEMMMGYIEEVLLLLMRNKPYSKITIGEITTKAGVNRSTYYRHFSSKESIIQSYLDSIMEEYQNRFRSVNRRDLPSYFKIMFETFYEKKENLLLIHRSGLSYLFLPVLMNQFHFDEIPEENQFRAAYHLGGINSNMLLWFEHDMREKADEMTRIALQCRPKDSLTLYKK